MIKTIQEVRMCDCLGEQGMPSLGDASVDLVFTDPPYGKEYNYLYGAIAEEFKRVLKPGRFAFIYASDYWFANTFNDVLEHLDFFYLFHIILPGDNARIHPKQLIIRAKTLMVFTNGKACKHEYCVNTLEGVRNSGLHPWQQRLSDSVYIIEHFSHEGDLVLDPFVGSGTTPRGARVANRNFIGYEIDQSCEEIIKSYALTNTPKMTEY